MKRNDYQHTSCIDVSVLIDTRRKYGRVMRRQFAAWLMRQCRAGQDINSMSIGQWANDFEALSLKAAA